MEIQRFVTLDQDGQPTGFYSTDVMPVERMPAERVAISQEIYAALRSTKGRLVDGAVQPPRPQPLTVADFEHAIQAHIDDTARTRGYRHGDALAGYTTSTVAAWAVEAAAFVAWRDAVWGYALTELVKVQNAERPVPTVEAMIAELPGIRWP